MRPDLFRALTYFPMTMSLFKGLRTQSGELIGRATAIAIMLTAMNASSVFAQTKTKEQLIAIRREDCRLAQAQAGNPAPSAGVLVNLAQCAEEGGATLPTVWRRLGDRGRDPNFVQSLMNATSNLRDGRIANALFAIAADSTKVGLTREAAIMVLASYVKPSLRGQIDRSLVPGEGWNVVPSRVVDVTSDDGAIALQPDYRTRLSGLLDSISKDTAHVSLRRLARFLKQEVSP